MALPLDGLYCKLHEHLGADDLTRHAFRVVARFWAVQLSWSDESTERRSVSPEMG